MEKKKNEKVGFVRFQSKQKKIITKGADEDKIKNQEKVLESTTLMNADGCQKKGQADTAVGPEGNGDQIQEVSGQKGRSKSENFYVAHPRNIKQTTHYKNIHSKKMSELLEAFHMFDFDRDGVINHNDLKKTFASLCIDIKEEEINQMLSEGLYPLNFDAFVILLGRKTLDLDPEEVLLAAFSNWDEHQEGLISYERLKQHMLTWSDKFTEEEAVAALADAPIVLNKTKERMIDYIQFSEDLSGLRKMMQRKTNEGENSASQSNCKEGIGEI